MGFSSANRAITFSGTDQFEKRAGHGRAMGNPPEQLNVLGLPIELCCQDPVTGFFVTGTAIPDRLITVCIRFVRR